MTLLGERDLVVLGCVLRKNRRHILPWAVDLRQRQARSHGRTRLKPPEEVGGGIGIAQPAPEKPKKKKRKGGDDDDLDAPEPTGIQWKPLAFLVLMVLPGLAPVVIGVLDYVNANGYQIPGQALFSPNPYKPACRSFMRTTRQRSWDRWMTRSSNTQDVRRGSLPSSPKSTSKKRTLRSACRPRTTSRRLTVKAEKAKASSSRVPL